MDSASKNDEQSGEKLNNVIAMNTSIWERCLHEPQTHIKRESRKDHDWITVKWVEYCTQLRAEYRIYMLMA